METDLKSALRELMRGTDALTFFRALTELAFEEGPVAPSQKRESKCDFEEAADVVNRRYVRWCKTCGLTETSVAPLLKTNYVPVTCMG